MQVTSRNGNSMSASGRGGKSKSPEAAALAMVKRSEKTNAPGWIVCTPLFIFIVCIIAGLFLLFFNPVVAFILMSLATIVIMWVTEFYNFQVKENLHDIQ